jgi:hypothetical protein
LKKFTLHAGTPNRIVAGAWAEAQPATPYLAMLDTNMVFTAEPRLERADAGVHPVDTKGSTLAGPEDPFDV